MKTKMGVLLVVFALVLPAISAKATILWVGSEDLDFPAGGGGCAITNAGTFRSAYARESVEPCSSIAISNPFQGGLVTSVWMSAELYLGISGCCGQSWTETYLGLINNANNIGIGIGGSSASNGGGTQTTLYTYNNGTLTRLAGEATSTLIWGLNKIDIQVISYGASGTVNVYVNKSSTPTVSYTGNIAAGGNTGLNAVYLATGNIGGGSGYPQATSSEVVVSTTDSRAFSVATLAPNGAGTTNQWTGSYTNIDTTSYNDTSVIADNTSGDTFECTVGALPAGSYSVQAVKVGARAAYGGSGLTSLSVGVLTNGSVNAPAATALGAAFGEVETYYSTNPITGTAWSTGDFGTLQINLKSAP